MKRIIAFGALMFTAVIFASGISPYILVAELPVQMEDAMEKAESVLVENGYRVIGDYHPGGNSALAVLVFTSKEMEALCSKSKDRGMLAAAMKLGFQKKQGKIAVSIVNPEYLFYAYFGERMDQSPFRSKALAISSGIKKAMRQVGTMDKPFGGDLKAEKLISYRYMAGMPGFSKAVELGEFGSFREALSVIRKNLSAGKGKTSKVYELVNEREEVAVFGIGLGDREEGEAHFLPIIGESHVAAMPYEIILEGKEVSMLHGRYRFALHWPELTMKTFTKIMSSPGEVEDAMKKLVE